MTDPGDKLARRYRELAREEPPASLDASILAAARRAVAAKPFGSRRWAVPMSIAAVLVLAFGVTLEMQREAPDVAYAPPQARVPEAKPQVPPAADREMQEAPAVKAESQQAPATAKKLRQAPALQGQMQSAPSARRDMRQEPAAREQKDRAAPQAPARSEPAPREEARTPPQPMTDALERSNAAPAAAAAPAPPSKSSGALVAEPFSQAPESRAKARALDAAPAMREQLLRADPARERERIAKLREDGRHEEADKALEAFRRANPGFRIPEAMWERVKPR
jgi:hypothetical protein